MPIRGSLGGGGNRYGDTFALPVPMVGSLRSPFYFSALVERPQCLTLVGYLNSYLLESEFQLIVFLLFVNPSARSYPCSSPLPGLGEFSIYICVCVRPCGAHPLIDNI